LPVRDRTRRRTHRHRGERIARRPIRFERDEAALPAGWRVGGVRGVGRWRLGGWTVWAHRFVLARRRVTVPGVSGCRLPLPGGLRGSAPGFGSGVRLRGSAPGFGSGVRLRGSAPGFGSGVRLRGSAPGRSSGTHPTVRLRNPPVGTTPEYGSAAQLRRVAVGCTQWHGPGVSLRGGGASACIIAPDAAGDRQRRRSPSGAGLPPLCPAQNEKPGHPVGCPALVKPELRLVVSTSSCKTAIAAAMRNGYANGLDRQCPRF